MKRAAVHKSVKMLLAIAVLAATVNPLRADCAGCGHGTCELSHAAIGASPARASESPAPSCCHKHAAPEPVCPPVSAPCGECCRPGEPLARAEVAPSSEREQVNPLTLAILAESFAPQADGSSLIASNSVDQHSSTVPLRILLCVWRN